MANGYMGKILNVHLTSGTLVEEPIPEQLCRLYIGGYGLGARILYDRIPAGANPLGPNNVLGLTTGPLTGTPAIIGSRFAAVGKSPKTMGGWGDANCGGDFGPYMKFAGFDNLFFDGISPEPVYLFIEDGKAELKDAGEIWGMGVTPMEDLLKERHGKDVAICSIGPAGEQMSLTACIMNDKERAAGRSGLGAVMGSKRLKAVVVKGKMKVPINDEARLKEIRKQMLKSPGDFFGLLRDYGTAGLTHDSVMSGDGPVKNWGGSGGVEFSSERSRMISDNAVVGKENYKPYGCWHCPIACGGTMSQTGGKFPLEYNNGYGHKPEYETLAMFGSNLMNDDLDSIVKVNEICNNMGMDTITVGATIGYAIECYENGLITKEDTGGIELTWGNAEAIVEMTEKIATREGFGDVLADGVRVACEKLGGKGKEFGIEIGGEEIPAHDPRFIPGLGSTYTMCATPGRHTQGGEMLIPPGATNIDELDKFVYSGHSENHRKLVAGMEVVNAAGLCMFGYLTYDVNLSLPEQLSAVTGWDWNMEEVYKAGVRIYTMRHVFNLREGINPLVRHIPGRIMGEPPLTSGNNKGVSVNYKNLNKEFLENVGWDTQTTVPREESLKKLEMNDLIEDMKQVKVPVP